MEQLSFADPHPAAVARAKGLTPAAGSVKTGNRMAPHAVRAKDLYETPPECTRALLAFEDLPQRLWEPACGPGAMVRVLRDAGHDCFASDLGDYQSADQNVGLCDFLKQHALPLIASVDGSSAPAEAIVTNPPYKLDSQFAAHALSFGVPVYMLLRTLFVHGAAAKTESGRARRRAVWGGAKLARIYFFNPRPKGMHRDGYEGPKTDSGQQDYAWFCWHPDHEGPWTGHLIDPRPYREAA